MPEPKDIIFTYDGSLFGLYTAIHECVYSRTLPADILPEALAPLSLIDHFRVETDPDKARDVRNSIPKKICPDALDLVENVFLSCLEQKELHILRFLLRGYRVGPSIIKMLGDPLVHPLLKAERHLLHEAHQLTGFVRFSEYDNALAATITPKNFVLPYIANHFCKRYSNENFLIFDKTHKAALVYQDHRRQIVSMDDIQFPEVREQELRYRELWKQFYKSIAIGARENPRCRMTHLPKRYWENMTEMKELL